MAHYLLFGFNTDIVMSMISITAMAGPGTMIRVSIQHFTPNMMILIPSLLPNLLGVWSWVFMKDLRSQNQINMLKQE